MKVTSDQGLLRFMTCGSVDDGKSTLIGRLLHDADLLLVDQLDALVKDSLKFGVGGEIDMALLLDGLEAEREQGITIDVAFRYFGTSRRRFIVADTPGHEQYTRNMATGASMSDLAVLLVDATKGLLRQTRHHAFIAWLLGIRDVVLAVNKMDLVGYDKAAFARIRDEFGAFAAPLGLTSVQAIPVAARFGENVVRPGPGMDWYSGPPLLGYLETVSVGKPRAAQGFRMPVQWVNRTANFRGYCGTIAGGRIRPGDTIVVAESGRSSRVERIVTFNGDSPCAGAGDAVTLILAEHIDVSRGDVLASAEDSPTLSDALAAWIVWFSDEALFPGRSYLLKCGTRTVGATVTEIKHRVDTGNFSQLAARELHINDIGVVNVALDRPIAVDPYETNPTTGAFILIDRFSNATVGAGMVRFPLRRGSNISWQAFDVTKESRARMKGQRPVMLWFTGLSGSGKSTIANLVERKLTALGRHTFLLDGDNVRHGLNKDLGFTDADRVENIRRAAELGKLFVDAGLIALVVFISPFRAERRMARDLMEQGEFIEIFVDAPLEVCEQRDPKGLYRKARSGALENFTGIDSPYESPHSPELRLDSAIDDAEILADRIVSYLHGNGYLR